MPSHQISSLQGSHPSSRSLPINWRYSPLPHIELFRHLHRTSLSFPQLADIEFLVEKSSCQFIFAATVIRYTAAGGATGKGTGKRPCHSCAYVHCRSTNLHSRHVNGTSMARWHGMHGSGTELPRVILWVFLKGLGALNGGLIGGVAVSE